MVEMLILGRDAHLDHKLSQRLGGDTRIENLQWVIPAANYAKREATIDDFVHLCQLVVDYHKNKEKP